MLTKKELRTHSQQMNYNTAQIEKDYLQHLFLLYLYKATGNEFIFKGGTALQKCLSLNRFSEDLDFTFIGENNNISEIVNDITQKMSLLYETDVQTPKQRITFDNSEKFILKIKGPLFTPGKDLTLASLRIDISLREKLLSNPSFIAINPIYSTIPLYSVKTMSYDEILAEKIRAIISRKKARDIYDVWFLLKKNIRINTDLVKQKLLLVQQKYSERLLIKKIKEKEFLWEKELKSLLIDFPEFQIVFDEIRSFLA